MQYLTWRMTHCTDQHSKWFVTGWFTNQTKWVICVTTKNLLMEVIGTLKTTIQRIKNPCKCMTESQIRNRAENGDRHIDRKWGRKYEPEIVRAILPPPPCVYRLVNWNPPKPRRVLRPNHDSSQATHARLYGSKQQQYVLQALTKINLYVRVNTFISFLNIIFPSYKIVSAWHTC